MLGKGPLMPFFNNRSMDDWLKSFDQYVNKGLTQFEKFADQMSFEVDTEETADDYKIRANLKDYNPEDLQIEILNQGLQIKAQREEIRSTKNKRTGHFQQRKSMKRTERFVQLPFMFRNEDVNAQYTNGILTISVNKNGGEVMNPTVPIQVNSNETSGTVAENSMNANNTTNQTTDNGQFEE
ncbi:Hsp20/alpha crystallin family protein [Fictibacillus sp. 7GRE50]|jgi:HSP20 family protein|uniref:Hsp20/alpha crystallin family protein n=1 Tax=unclassified Fictibacillus TaxID=2644029 RepID=UPI0018CEF457|nr:MULTISPECIES: Hsp20/alpha crystallin family protein [unclassified Fictibacillus]MBH0166927.1 Hsp20/alpha crystallin family protein [Fictibacillus sp. 7GRE50]MBH0174976.1 Hsp20/alpha crystallin family protein [Fictibacillus sp. 23RED33]